MSTNDRPFHRQLFGYRRADVDAHLTSVDASIAELRAAVDAATTPDHQDLVMRATRLAVADILQRAHDDAGQIRANAEAEASRLLADAYDLAAARDRVIDLRQTESANAEADAEWQFDLSRVIED